MLNLLFSLFNKSLIILLIYLPYNSWAIGEKLPLADLQRFTKVIENIHTYYVEPAKDNELFENGIRGMLEGLDPHSSYMDEEEYAELKQQTSGKFGGLGIEVIPENGLIRIISAIDDTPAYEAGIKAGDLIIQIDGKPVKGMSLRDAVKIMRGKPNTHINLTILREKESKPLIFKVTRAVIKTKSVKHKIFDDNYGYIRVSQFQENSANEFITAIKKIKKGTNNDLKGLIIDLRNNPGGILDSCVQMVDSFLDKRKLGKNKTIVYTEGRIPGSKLKEYAHNGDITNDSPIVVIVNGGSASASEIMAGAIQDHKRGLIIGLQTFGKGSVQTILPLKNNRGLKITTALYYTPNGRSIQAKGITPDIKVEPLKINISENNKEYNVLGIKESMLKGHLENKNDTSRTATDNSESNEPLWHKDFQLYQALLILKSLTK